MAEATGDRWWLPALYWQRSELQPPDIKAEMRQRALDLCRRQNSGGLERRILAASHTVSSRAVFFGGSSG